MKNGSGLFFGPRSLRGGGLFLLLLAACTTPDTYAEGFLDGFESGYEQGTAAASVERMVEVPLWQGKQPTELPSDGEREDVF